MKSIVGIDISKATFDVYRIGGGLPGPRGV